MTTLKIYQLSKRFENKKAVSDVSFSVQDGECLALIGPNGAGKTTLINMLVQILKPDQGSILLDGEKMSGAREKIGFLPQYPAFYGFMTAVETLRFMGRLSKMSGKELEMRIDEVLQQVGLSEEGKKRVSGFSGGMRQRLGIAQAILHKPKLLVLDEPVSALDPIGRREVITLIEELKKETTILFSTHILQDAEEICDHITMMSRGEIVLDKPLSEIKKEASTSVFEVEFACFPEQWFEEIRKSDRWIRTERIGTICRFEANNRRIDGEWLFNEAGNAGLEIQRFENIHESLEQIFMKKVGE